MTDERYTFVDDVREKKRTARGYYNKVRKGGRMKLPYDYLTAKEKKSLNGEVTTYSMNERIPWKQFKFMPVDIQREYIDKLIANGGGFLDICEYLGVGQDTFAAWCKAHGVKFKRGHRSDTDKAKWASFINPEPKPELKPEAQPEPKVETATGIDKLAEILKALVGTGAKLTIEVTL